MNYIIEDLTFTLQMYLMYVVMYTVGELLSADHSFKTKPLRSGSIHGDAITSGIAVVPTLIIEENVDFRCFSVVWGSEEASEFIC